MKRTITIIFMALCLMLTGCFKQKEAESTKAKTVYRYAELNPRTGFIVDLDTDGDTIKYLTYIRTETKEMMEIEAEVSGASLDEVYENKVNKMKGEYALLNSSTLPDYPFYNAAIQRLEQSKFIQVRYEFDTSDKDFLKYIKEGNETIILTLRWLGIYEAYSPSSERFSYKRLQNCESWKNAGIDSEVKYDKELEEALWMQ